MTQPSTFLAEKRYAVVTGANKGIGFEICRQLASHGIVVVLTARDEKRGLEAVEKLKHSAQLSDDQVIFHQLDVTNSATIASLTHFITTQFGKLDILVNNAGIGGAKIDSDPFTRSTETSGGEHVINWNDVTTETYELAEECLNINYYGGKRMVESLSPLLQLSDSARIVNVSSLMGLLQNIPNEQVKKVLSEVESLTEERVDELLNKYLEDFKEGLLEKEGWPIHLSAYTVSKAALNAYTRIVARKYPAFLVNCVCPGYAKTDVTWNTGFLTAAIGAESPVELALLPPGAGPSGLLFDRKFQMSSF